jgi:hydrogenase expression/formation protein HypC
MCLGIPGRVLALEVGHADLASVEVAGMARWIDVGLLRGQTLEPGDWVLIHAGAAIEKIDEERAHGTVSFAWEEDAEHAGFAGRPEPEEGGSS